LHTGLSMSVTSFKRLYLGGLAFFVLGIVAVGYLFFPRKTSSVSGVSFSVPLDAECAKLQDLGQDWTVRTQALCQAEKTGQPVSYSYTTKNPPPPIATGS